MTIGPDRRTSGDSCLLDGGAVVRPIVPGDTAALLRFHAHLSRHSVEMRYLYPHLVIGPEEAARLTRVDGVGRMAYVVESGRELVAVARYEQLDDPTRAEVAFVVADGWQNRGIATHLFDRLASRARAAGIRTFCADVRTDNVAMLAVFHDSGHPTTSHCEAGVVSLAMAIEQAPGCAGQSGTCQLTRIPPPSAD